MVRIPFYDSTNWIHRDLQYRDFTFRGWMDFIDALEKPVFQGSDTSIVVEPLEYKEGEIPHPWTHRHIAARIFRGIFMWNLRMRWICRKWISRVRSRIASRRIIGVVDIVTMDPIPKTHLVSVQDYKSRSTYHFHCHSMQRLLRESLLFQTYGISHPVAPKNPYTNLPWTTGQILVLMDQIQRIHWNQRHRYVSPLLQWYRETGYCIKQLKKEHSQELSLLAAGSFFRDIHNPEVQEIVEEVLSDLLEELGLPKRGFVVQYVSKRSVLPELQQQWDCMVLYLWIYQNYQQVMHPQHLAYESMIAELRTLYKKTLEWIASKRPNRSTARIRPPESSS